MATKSARPRKAGTLPAGPVVEQWPLDRIIPYENNPRINDAAVDAVALSIRKFGFRNPILVDGDGVIVAGHTRLKAARLLDLAAAPVIVARDLTPEQVRAYRLADNKTASLSEWDFGKLAEEFRGMPEVDWTALGWTQEEVEAVLAGPGTEGETDPDAVPEAPKEVVSVRGEVYVLGTHRVMCGDSTDAGDVARLMGGECAALCFTSPPYAQQRDYGAKITDWDGLMRGVFGTLPMADDGQVLVNLGLVHRDGEWWPYWDGWIAWMREQGWKRSGWYVWDKGQAGRADGQRLPTEHEFVWHFCKAPSSPVKCEPCKSAGSKYTVPVKYSGKDGQNRTRKEQGTVPGFKVRGSVCHVYRNAGSDMAHPAAFPVAFASWFIESWTGSVYDPFLGSGTTIIAAEQLGRRCFGLEICERYIDVAIIRWQEFTGKQAILEETGETFDKLRKQRAHAKA